VCERIPYLILPVRQLSRKPFGSRQSATSEPSSMTPGPSRIEPSAQAQICRSDTSEPSGKPPNASRIETIYPSRRARRRACVKPTAEALRASRRARRRARLDPNHPQKCRERAVGHTAETTHICHQAAAGHTPNHPPSRSRRASHRVNYRASEPAGGRFQYRTEPLRLFAVNPLMVGDLRRTVMWGFILV